MAAAVHVLAVGRGVVERSVAPVHVRPSRQDTDILTGRDVRLVTPHQLVPNVVRWRLGDHVNPFESLALAAELRIMAVHCSLDGSKGRGSGRPRRGRCRGTGRPAQLP